MVTVESSPVRNLRYLLSLSNEELRSRKNALDELRTEALLVLSEAVAIQHGQRQTSPELSSLASRVLSGYEPNREEIESMAGSLLAQDETPGQGDVLVADVPADDVGLRADRALADAQRTGQAHPFVDVEAAKHSERERIKRAADSARRNDGADDA